MKYVKEYLNDVIKVKPLGELTTEDDELNGMSGEMVYIDGKCSDIFISHADYANWLEKQTEQKLVWSEEDEKFFKTALWHISYSISNGESTYVRSDTTEWLKSLKDRMELKKQKEN